jgi:phage host-nuclease inhibitor protein Gam
MENGLQAFAEHRKEELFSNRRSVELDFGTLGYRRSHEVKPKPRTTWAQVLGKLKELRFHEAVRVKEAVDKDELRSWPDERLESVGARRVQKDTFWYEINAQKVAEEAA